MLRDLSFTARPGQTTAIIGSTGAGKTTLVNLVPRLFDVTGGEVYVDGVDVRGLDPELLWARIGLVPQKAFLFSGTVASNLRYGKPDATEEEMWAALEIAQARDFVEAMPERARGADHPGRHQRLRRPAAAAGDRPGADPAARRSTCSTTRSRPSTWPPTRGCGRRCAPVTRDATVVIVAQRVSTIIDADQILVLEDGVVVGRGHARGAAGELSRPTRRSSRSQLTAEEAA